MHKAIACLIVASLGLLALPELPTAAQVAEPAADEGGKIVLHDAQGTDRAEVSLAEGATTINLRDPEGKDRIRLRIDRDGLQVEMLDVNSRPRAELSFGPGEIDLGLLASGETIVGEMVVEQDGNFIMLRAPGGPEQAHIGIGPQESHMVLMDPMGRPALEFAIDGTNAFCHFIDPESAEEEEEGEEEEEEEDEAGEGESEAEEEEAPTEPDETEAA